LHGDVLMWLMKTLLTSGCTNQRGAGHEDAIESYEASEKDLTLSEKLLSNLVAEAKRELKIN
ncbi:hypothetical protein, partial [Enterobacter hormaechei]|uniref:hypothetical protein n=1 Tax=Enterobacter hormaechei TaxID=158836 RepID=UPI003BC0A623